MKEPKILCSYSQIANPEELKPNPKNPNMHPDKQINILGEMIENYGWRVPITVSKRSGFVVRGHGRLLVALNKGWTKVPIDYQDYNSDKEEIADLLGDNKIAEFSFTDYGLLSENLDWLNELDFDIQSIGFEDEINTDETEENNSEPYFNFKIIIECNNEQHQVELLEELEEKGLKCKALIL